MKRLTLNARLASMTLSVAVVACSTPAADDGETGTSSDTSTTADADTSTSTTTEDTGTDTGTSADDTDTGTDDTDTGTDDTGTEDTGTPMDLEPEPPELGTCDTISDFVPGAQTCWIEASRCTISVPAGISCAEVCDELGQTCLRAYEESDTCLAAVYNDALGCDAAPSEPSFCQCGDPTLQYPQIQIVTIGDSTMDNTKVPGEAGWGNQFPPFGVRPQDIHNWGSSGASSLDFETRPNWPEAQALLAPDVYLFIQFGHNDASGDLNRHTEPGVPPDYEGTYPERLWFYADAAREAGATPVILTSLGRMVFNEDGATTYPSHGNYVPSARKFAEDEGLLMLDANRASRGEYERLGQTQTLELYSFDDPSHFTPEGATRMAELTVRLACIESEELCAQFVPVD